MEIVLFLLGALLIIIGLPICFSCEIRAAFAKMSKNGAGQSEKTIYQHERRNRGVGLIFIAIGFILIVLSFAGSAM
jgi:hypothetical protein